MTFIRLSRERTEVFANCLLRIAKRTPYFKHKGRKPFSPTPSLTFTKTFHAFLKICLLEKPVEWLQSLFPHSPPSLFSLVNWFPSLRSMWLRIKVQCFACEVSPCVVVGHCRCQSPPVQPLGVVVMNGGHTVLFPHFLLLAWYFLFFSFCDKSGYCEDLFKIKQLLWTHSAYALGEVLGWVCRNWTRNDFSLSTWGRCLCILLYIRGSVVEPLCSLSEAKFCISHVGFPCGSILSSIYQRFLMSAKGQLQLRFFRICILSSLDICGSACRSVVKQRNTEGNTTHSLNNAQCNQVSEMQCSKKSKWQWESGSVTFSILLISGQVLLTCFAL